MKYLRGGGTCPPPPCPPRGIKDEILYSAPPPLSGFLCALILYNLDPAHLSTIPTLPMNAMPTAHPSINPPMKAMGTPPHPSPLPMNAMGTPAHPSPLPMNAMGTPAHPSPLPMNAMGTPRSPLTPQPSHECHGDPRSPLTP